MSHGTPFTAGAWSTQNKQMQIVQTKLESNDHSAFKAHQSDFSSIAMILSSPKPCRSTSFFFFLLLLFQFHVVSFFVVHFGITRIRNSLIAF